MIASPSTLKSSPKIDSVLNHTDGHTDRLTPGGLFTITGHGFGHFPEVPFDIGVYINSASDNGLIRVHRYVHWRDDEICGYWPTGLFGPFWLFLETFSEEGAVHSAVHKRPLSLKNPPALAPAD